MFKSLFLIGNMSICKIYTINFLISQISPKLFVTSEFVRLVQYELVLLTDTFKAFIL